MTKASTSNQSNLKENNMPTKTKSQDLIVHTFKNFKYEQRKSDGYYNATQMCEIFNKRFNNYHRTEKTQKFLKSLSAVTLKSVSELVLISKGGDAKNQKTFIHPLVANHLAFNLDSEFAVEVSLLTEAWKQGRLEYKPKPKFPKQPRTADRVQATIATKSLNDVIISKLSQAPDKIFLHVEEKIHKAITRMTASYHKKKMNGNNGIDLLCFHERSALVYAKEALILELEKHKDGSLTRAEIRALTDSVCDGCRELVGFFESKNVLNKVRYMDILPAVEQKTLLLSVA